MRPEVCNEAVIFNYRRIHRIALGRFGNATSYHSESAIASPRRTRNSRGKQVLYFTCNDIIL